MSYNAFEDQDELPSLKEATTKNNNIVKEKKKMTEQVKETTVITELPKKEGVVTFKGLQELIKNQQKELDAKMEMFFNFFTERFNEYIINLVKQNPSSLNSKHTMSNDFVNKLRKDMPIKLGEIHLDNTLEFCVKKINKIDSNYNMVITILKNELRPELDSPQTVPLSNNVTIEIFKDKEISRVSE